LAYSGAAISLSGKMAELGDYIQASEYKNDDGQKGNQLHAAILEELPKTVAQRDAFIPILTKREDERRLAEIEYLKSEGMIIAASMIYAIGMMEKFNDYLIEKEATAENALEVLKESELAPLYADYSNAAKLLESEINDRQVAQEGMNPVLLAAIASDMKAFDQAAGSLLETVKAGKIEGDDFEGDPQNLIDIYSDIVDNYNDMIEDAQR
jgi:hypothetical protein